MSNGLLERVAAGEAAAVDECMAAYRGLVWSLARRGTANLADAEDAVQEIFIEIWRTASRYDPLLSSESTYITMIARRRLIDRFRRRERSLKTVSLSGDSGPNIAANPESDALERKDESSRLRQRMKQLRQEERTVLELSFDEGMSQSEIAATTSMPLGTVKTHARRGMKRLRELLERDSQENGERNDR